MTPHDIFLVFVEGREGKQGEYAEWFAGPHMADMERLPGVISARAYRLESLDDQAVPAQLCAIYETVDGPGILQTIATAKGTDALPDSDIQGPMTWRVLEGHRAFRFTETAHDSAVLVCMFGGAWDQAAEDRLWQWLGDNSRDIAAVRQTRLSPVQPVRGSEYSGILFVTLLSSSDPSRLVDGIRKVRSAPDARFLLARPLDNRASE